MRITLISGVILGICTSLLGGCERADAPAAASPDKLGEYLYYIEYDDYIPEIAGSVTQTGLKGGCSTVRNENLLGHNRDMGYCDCPEFVVRMKASDDRFASIGLSANPYIGTNVSELSQDELMRMPTITNDGINQNGVLASVHVVRYVLDHAKSAQHAVALLEQANIVGGFEHYGLHWMIADEKNTYIVEVIEGRLSVSRNEYSYFTK